MSDEVIKRLRLMHLEICTDTEREQWLTQAAERIGNLEAALDHAKLEFYAAGRRDLVVELLADLGYLEGPERIIEAADAGEDFTEQPALRMDQLARHYFTTVEEMKQVPRLKQLKQQRGH